MQSYKQRVLLLEFLHRKPGLTLPEVSKDPEILNDLILNVFDDLIRSKVELRNQGAADRHDYDFQSHLEAHQTNQRGIEGVFAANRSYCLRNEQHRQ